MRNRIDRLSLLSYVQAFFPSNFVVHLRQSIKDPDERVLTIRDAITGNTASYEGSTLSILDICSMANIAGNLCQRLVDQAATDRTTINAEKRQA